MRRTFFCIMAACAPSFAAAQVTPAVTPAVPSAVASAGASAATPAAPPACCIIPALTGIRFRFVATMNSQVNKIGEQFAIQLADPIVVDGRTLVPAGVSGSGDVVHAEKSRFGGRPGEMILAVRYLDYNGVRIPLRKLSYTDGQGHDRGNVALAMGIAGGAIGGLTSMFVTGGEVNIPAGTEAYARTAAPVTVPPPAEPAVVAPTQNLEPHIQKP